MRRLGAFYRRLLGLVRRRRLEQDLDDELAFHLAMREADHREAGLSPDSAHVAARRQFGSVTLLKEQAREAWTFPSFESWWQDLRFAVRFLRRAPGFTVVTILTLVLGIGANAAIFQLLDAVRLRTLAVDHPDQLVEVHAADMTRGRMGHFSGRRPAVTYPLWEQIRDRQRVFSGVFAWGATPLNVGTGGRAHYVQGLWVSGGFFSVLGLHPAAGRLLLPADDQVGCGLSAVVISDAFWQAEYGRDARVIGKALRINDHPVDIVGVAPAGFDGVEIGRTFDVAVPVCAQPNLESDTGQLHDRGWWWLAVMGRLKPGVTIHEASAQLESMSAESFAATAPLAFLPDVRQAYLATKLRAFPAQTGVSTGLREEYSTPLWVLFGMTGFVLVIACANVSNLLLVRAAVREREMALRLALGAAHRRIVRQLLIESAMLALGGTALGAGVAVVLSRAVLALFHADEFQFMAISLRVLLNWHVFAFAAALASVTCLLFGLVPAIRLARSAPHTAIKSSGRGLSERFGMRGSLVTAQVGLSLMLLIGAFLFVQTLHNLERQHAGFNTDHLVWASIDYQRADLPMDRRHAVRRAILERIQAIPGVESVASVQQVPLTGESAMGPIVVDGIGQQTQSYFTHVGAGYFQMMQTQLLAGRDFSEQDVRSRVAIVNHTFTRQFLHGANPVGRTFQIRAAPGQSEPAYEIVGLVEDTKYNDLREPFQPIAFLFDGQIERPFSNFNVVLRSQRPVGELTMSVTQAVATVNAQAVVFTPHV